MAIEAPNSMSRYYRNPYFVSTQTSQGTHDGDGFYNFDVTFHRLNSDVEPVIFHGLFFS